MKKIALFLFLFVAVCFAIWAQNKRTSDYPNTAVPNTSDLMLIARPGSPGTNLNITFAQLYSVTTTNVLNIQNVSLNKYADNTNQIVVYNVGDAASQGIYTFYMAAPGPVFQYTNNNNNGRFVAWDPAQNDWEFAITNGTGTVLYMTTSSPLTPPSILPQTFFHVSGSLPNGVITWGTNVTVVTKTFANFQYGVPNLAQSYGNIWYVRTNGDDTFALKGRPDRPALTLHCVFTNWTDGDIVDIGPGQFDDESVIGYKTPTFKPGVTLRGAGRRVTYIKGIRNLGQWNLANSNNIGGFTATNLWIYDGGGKGTQGVTTNVYIHDIEDSATGDVIVFQAGTSNAIIEHCWLDGNSDKIADLTSIAGGVTFLTNSIITIHDVWITGGPGAGGNGLNFGGGNGGSGIMQVRGGGLHIDVTGMVAEQKVLTNGNFGFVFAPYLLQTNFVGGQLYTNGYSVPLDVAADAVLTMNAATAGDSTLALWTYLPGTTSVGRTNQVGFQTTASTVSFTNICGIRARIPPGYTWTFTNRSTGSGNSAAIQTQSGTLFIP
jgi:hypothetical protein